MEENILYYSSTVMIRGTPCILINIEDIRSCYSLFHFLELGKGSTVLLTKDETS